MAMRKNAGATGARAAAVTSTATAEALQRKENDIKKSFKVRLIKLASYAPSNITSCFSH